MDSPQPDLVQPHGPVLIHQVQVFAHDALSFDCNTCGYSSVHYGELVRHRRKNHRGLQSTDHFHSGCACACAFPSRLAAAAHACSCPTAAHRPAAPVETFRPLRLRSCPQNKTTPTADVHPQGRNSPGRMSPPSTITPSDPTPTFAPQRHVTPKQGYIRRAGAKRSRPTPSPDQTDTERRELDGAARATVTEISEAEPPPAHSATTEHSATAPPNASDGDSVARQLEWTLQFDGACRGRNATDAGAGAILKDPHGAAAWTASVYLKGRQTNNSAEYQALLAGVEAAAQHGCTALRVEGDSALVLAQVKGEFSCTNKRLRSFRNRARRLLGAIATTALIHIDRMANGVADRLANRALDRKRSAFECTSHGTRLVPCPAPTLSPCSQGQQHDDDDHAEERPPRQARTVPAPPVDDAETFPSIRTTPESVPEHRPRLRLRKLTEEEAEQATHALETLSRRLLTRLRDAVSWADGEGILCAIAPAIHDALAPFTAPPSKPRPATRRARCRRVPPSTDDRPGAQHFHQRLSEMQAALQDPSSSRRDANRARRATGRARAALERESLRRRFDRDESGCVRSTLAKAQTQTTPTAPNAHPDNVCPAPAEDVYGYFEGLHTPRVTFDFDAPSGAPFRELLEELPPATAASGVLSDEILMDEVEDLLLAARRQSAPGHDGIGYDILHRFKAQLLPLLHAAYSHCWQHRRVPATWKFGVVKLVYKKGSPTVPSNWRPLCLQPTLYKLYASIMARRLSRWLEANDRLTPAQKGFRAMNGCNEHNFLAAMALDDARRSGKALYLVWYDLQNAFGSIPPELIWRTMAAIGVDTAFIDCCRAIYTDSHYTVVNTATGPTPPIAHRLGVYQGCPLSPFLFLVGVMPLVRRLHHLPSTGVQLAEQVTVGVTAFADDIKALSTSKEGIEKAHGVMTEFLRWSTMAANPAKCATFGTCMKDRRRHEDAPTLLLHGEQVPALTLSETYRYLGVGDGFDHAVTDFQLDPKLKELRREAAALLRSGLRPTQIVKAIKVYIYSKLEYAFRHVRVNLAALERWDAWLRRGLRHLLRLPQATSTAFFYAPTSHGGLGLLPLVDMLAAIQVGHAWQMLHAPDPAVAATARAQIQKIAHRRYRLDTDHWRDRDEELMVEFLQGTLASSPHATRRRQSRDITSLWTEVQGHVKRYGLTFGVVSTDTSDQQQPLEADEEPPPPPRTPTLTTPTHPEPLERKTVMAQLKLHAKRRHAEKWRSQDDQGRTVAAHGGAGSDQRGVP